MIPAEEELISILHFCEKFSENFKAFVYYRYDENGKYYYIRYSYKPTVNAELARQIVYNYTSVLKENYQTDILRVDSETLELIQKSIEHNHNYALIWSN